jgi:putative transposase
MLVKINQFSIRQQCDLLDVNRSGLYYHPVPESAENLLYIRLLDEQYTEDPTYGVERMTAHLQRLGYRVNPKRVRRLLRTMGLNANNPSPDTSKTNPDHKVLPSLLRGVSAEYCDHIWSTDITYIRLEKGFVYLMAVIDWYSRYVLG